MPARKRATATTAPAKKATTAKPRGPQTSQFICNLVPSAGTEGDWEYADSVAAGVLGAVAAPPASLDLREAWWEVGNQEDTGSCVGWATAEGVARWHLTKAGKITKKQNLSPRHVWMSSKETDSFTQRPETFIEGSGTELKAAVEVLRKYGVALDADLPFHIATKMYTGSENTFYAGCAQRKIASYFNLHKNPATWKSWLAGGGGPILIGISVDQSFDSATTTGGVIDSFQPTTVRGGHAIAVVGYRADGTFIVRNSWTTAWGDKGFGYLKPAWIAAAVFDESYGVVL